jgi:hypothetical protein
MTDEAFVTVNGQRASTVRLRVAAGGPWHAELDFEQAPELAGAVTLKIGTLSLEGTLAPDFDGTFGLQRRARIVAGAGGWGKPVAAKNYHNDAGVKARSIAEDAAREVGEKIGDFLPAAERVGVDYVRQVGAASRALQDACGRGVLWWVGFDGVTRAGPRAVRAADKSTYEVLAYDPMQRLVTLAVDDPAAIGIGSVISERLDEPQTVREYEVAIEKGGPLRILAWTGGDGTQTGRLSSLLSAIAQRATDGKLVGTYRYRVVRMASDGRVELQAVRRGAGLPDVLPVSMWPGVAGAHAELAPGAEVLVEFIEGDRTQPIVSHFAGKDGQGFVPVSLALCGGTQAVARQGDLVQSGGPGAVLTLTPLPGNLAPSVLPATPYLVSFSVEPTDVGPLAKPLFGAISTGSRKVRA